MGIPPIIRPRPPVDLGGIGDATLRTRLSEIVSERDQLAGRVEPLEREVQAVRGEADAARAQNVTLNQANADLRIQLDRRETEVGTRDREIATLRTQLDRREAELGTRDREIETLRASEVVGRRAIAERDQLNLKLGELNDTVRSRDEVIAKHLAEIAELKARPATPTAGGTLLPISSVATTVAEQVSTAQTAIRAAGGFTLTNVSVRLKGVAEGDASKIRILGANDLRNTALAGAQDELTFDFSTTPGAPPVPADKVAVPNLAGLTQLAAQRALAAVGLRLDPASGKAPASAKAAPGQAFKQSPDPAALVDRGVAVLVVFAQ